MNAMASTLHSRDGEQGQNPLRRTSPITGFRPELVPRQRLPLCCDLGLHHPDLPERYELNGKMRSSSPRRFSGIEPVLKSCLEPVEHLLFDVFDVSELGPTCKITAFRRTLDLHEWVFYEWTFASVAVAARDASFRSCVRANHRASASQMSDSGTAMTETWARLTPRPIRPA